MDNLNKKGIIYKAERILQNCAEKYNVDGKNKKKIKELEMKCKKLKRHNIFWKISIAFLVTFLLIII